MPITAGMLVCSTYNDDGDFYRARVISVEQAAEGDARRVNVLYIDFGNQDWVAETELRAIPEGFCQIRPYAIPCALSKVSSNAHRSTF